MDKLEENSIQRFKTFPNAYNNPITYYIFHSTNNRIAEVLNPKIGSSILDIGCGTGLLLQQLYALHKDLKLFGIDISPEMLAQAKQNLQGIPDVSLQQGSANKLPYKDNSFDYVTCVISFHHHSDSETSLREMKRVAKSGGVILIADGNLDGILRKIFYKADQIINKEGKIHRYTKQEIYNLFQNTGLKKIIQQKHWYFNLITIGVKS